MRKKRAPLDPRSFFFIKRRGTIISDTKTRYNNDFVVFSSQVESLRKDIEILSQNHERDVDRKDAIIQMLDRDLEEVGVFARHYYLNILRAPKMNRTDVCVRSPRLTLVYSIPGDSVNTPIKEGCPSTARPSYISLETPRRFCLLQPTRTWTLCAPACPRRARHVHSHVTE